MILLLCLYRLIDTISLQWIFSSQHLSTSTAQSCLNSVTVFLLLSMCWYDVRYNLISLRFTYLSHVPRLIGLRRYQSLILVLIIVIIFVSMSILLHWGDAFFGFDELISGCASNNESRDWNKYVQYAGIPLNSHNNQHLIEQSSS